MKKWASFPLVELVKAEEGDHREEERRGEKREQRERERLLSSALLYSLTHLTHTWKEAMTTGNE